MAERRAGLGRGLGELFQRTDPDAPPHPVDQHVIVDKRGQVDGWATQVDVPRETSAPTLPVAAESEGVAGESGESLHVTVGPENGYYADIPIDAIHPNAKQPRTDFEQAALEELVESIREVGLLQPIVVRQDGEDAYELVMGERRWRASREAGLDRVPAIVRKTSDDDMLRDALLENIHRVQLNPLEEAAAYQQLMGDFGCTQQELARRIKRSRSQIANTVRLLNLPGAVQRQVAAGELTAGHARALLGLQDVTAQTSLAKRIITEGLSVRATEEIVTLAGIDRPKRGRTPQPNDPLLQELSSELGELFDAPVDVTRGRKKGKIVLEFSSDEDLQRIVGILRGA